MLNLVAVWVVLFTILLGWGLLGTWALQRIGGRVFAGAMTTFQTAWFGYAALLAFLQLCSLLLPMATTVIIISLLPAIAGYALQRAAVARRIRELRLRPRITIVTGCVVLLAAAVTAYAAFDLVQWYDTGLYHLQAVKWSTHYAAVPGLGNLHYRFGYNNSVHLFAAYTDAFWEGVTAHVTNSFLLILVLGQWFAEIFAARTPRGRLRQAFCLLTLPFLLTKLWTMEASSLSTDLPLAVFSYVLILEVISLRRGRILSALALIVALGAVATTTKLGGLGLFGAATLLALFLVRRAVAWRARIVIFALPALVVIGWIIRGVIASGWLLYPVFGKLPVGWAVPHEVARADLAAIESWSRMFGKGPDEVFGHGVWHWFGPWLDNFRTSHECFLLIVAVALLAWRVAYGPAVTALRRAGERAGIAGCVLGLVQWFTGAPDLRYGNFLFWLLAAVVAAPMFARVLRIESARPALIAFSLLMVSWAGGFAFHLNARVPKLWGRPPAPQTVKTARIPVGPGTEIEQPEKGDQCFDAELPCSPYNGTETQREHGSLGKGYQP